MKKSVLFILAGLLAVMCACDPGTNTSPPEATPAQTRQPSGVSRGEELCCRFVSENLTTDDGGIRTNYLDKAPSEQLATGAQVLSESMGLMMLYAVKTGDQARFESLLGFVKTRLDTGEILAYRYAPVGGAYHVNALIDDLRIIRALLLANDAFGGSYEEIALTYAQRLYQTNVKEDRAYDFYDEQYGVTNNAITLCYPDLDTILLLAARDEQWAPVYDEMLALMQGGYLGDGFPMYARSYSYESAAYSGDDIETVQSLLTMLSLSGVKACPQASVDFIKRHVANGTLYGTYTVDGKPVSNTESTAIYAICALIGKSEGDEELYRTSLDQMERFQVLDESSEVYGAFADARTLDLYAFDNLMALLAYWG